MTEFRAEVLATPHNPYNDEHLELWLRYYVETETFDRGICHRRQVDGTAIPASAGESKIIQDHAREVMKQLGLTQSRYPEERKYVSRMSYVSQQVMLERMKK